MSKVKVWLLRSPMAPIAIALGVAAYSNMAYAQTVTTQATLDNLLWNIVSWMINILLVVSVIMIVYAAFLYVTGGENAEKITNARRTITWAAVGLVVGLIAKGFPTLVQSLVSGSGSGSASSAASSFGSGAVQGL